MTTVGRLQQERFQKGIRTNALNIAETILDTGASLENALRFTSLTAEDLAEIDHQ